MNMNVGSSIDIHTHILPKVDDGAANLKSALQMLQCAKALNVDTIVTTPHLRRMQDIDPLKTAFTQFQPHASALGVRSLMGFEVSYRALESLSRIRECAIEGTNLLLLELPENTLMPNWERVLFELLDAGIQPVIAHPERYRYIQNNLDNAEQIRSFGCKLQIDARALTEISFSSEHRCAKKLFQRGLCDYIASDAHKAEDYCHFEKALAKYGECWPSTSLDLVMSRA